MRMSTRKCGGCVRARLGREAHAGLRRKSPSWGDLHRRVCAHIVSSGRGICARRARPRGASPREACVCGSLCYCDMHVGKDRREKTLAALARAGYARDRGELLYFHPHTKSTHSSVRPRSGASGSASDSASKPRPRTRRWRCPSRPPAEPTVPVLEAPPATGFR